MIMINTKDGYKDIFPKMSPVPAPGKWWHFQGTIPNSTNQALLDKFDEICGK